MFTAFRVSRPLRARLRMAGPERVLWLAVLLLALLYTHGVNGHNASAHASPLAAVTATASAESTEFGGRDAAPAPHDGDEAEHGSESCASGQPPYRAELPARATTPLGFAELTRVHAPASAVPADAVPVSATWRDPAILRV
ncbi:hypothetical protein ACFUN8_01290 [Streptomyces sp. NPDC057307]|uniref:hypothetical protein n=1 Tax=Streptomyces sp. NPDC057307 TaxID=3346096 RepID=UPI00362C648D